MVRNNKTIKMMMVALVVIILQSRVLRSIVYITVYKASDKSSILGGGAGPGTGSQNVAGIDQILTGDAWCMAEDCGRRDLAMGGSSS